MAERIMIGFIVFLWMCVLGLGGFACYLFILDGGTEMFGRVISMAGIVGYITCMVTTAAIVVNGEKEPEDGPI